MSNELANTIGKMREILIERGRAQGKFQKDDGSVCLLGAACVAQNIDPLDIRGAGNWLAVELTPVVLFLGVRRRCRRDNAAFGLSMWNDFTSDDTVILDFLHEAQLAAKEGDL